MVRIGGISILIGFLVSQLFNLVFFPHNEFLNAGLTFKDSLNIWRSFFYYWFIR